GRNQYEAREGWPQLHDSQTIREIQRFRHDPDGRRGCGMGIGRRGEGISLMAFNPLDTLANQITSQKKDPNNPGRHTMPKYSSGARTLIRIGGKALGDALDFKWQVS